MSTLDQVEVQRLEQDIHLVQELHSNKLNVDLPAEPAQTLVKPQGSTHPHRDNLPRRSRVRERTKTAPFNVNNTLAPLPISIVDSQSTITHDFVAGFKLDPPRDSKTVAEPEEDEETLLSLYPPPFRLNSKALSLISKAQNKAFKDRPSPIFVDSEDANGRHHPSSSMPTSPQLPHPAMGLTMGIMEAYAESEEDAPRMGDPKPVHAIFRSGLSYSPAMGVKGTPPTLTSTAFPPHAHTFVPLPGPVSAPIPTPTPIPILSPPVTAPLGQNLPRRHRFRRRVPQGEEGEVGVGVGRREKQKEEGRPELLRVLRVDCSKENLVEGNEEEDGLFSSLLDFERAGVGEPMSCRGNGRVIETEPRQKISSNRCGPRGRRRRREDPRCIQALGKSSVEVGYMSGSEIEEKGDCVVVEVVDGEGAGGERWLEEARSRQRLEICLQDNAAVCTEGVPTLSSEQVREGCEFMKRLIEHVDGKRRIRILVPRWRAPDAFGLALCFLVWFEETQRGRGKEGIVKPKVNDMEIETGLQSEKKGVGSSYDSVHRLYMRLLDDGDGGGREEDFWNFVGQKVGLGIVGVELNGEEEEDERKSVHSDSTTGCSRPTLVLPKKRSPGRGFHVREGALGGIGASSSLSSLSSSSVSSRCSATSSSSSSSSSIGVYSQESSLRARNRFRYQGNLKTRAEWRGLRDEWRGVLSYEGLNRLVGLWP